jgi:FMN phosphatase YigB (HAD superfamily)
VTSDIRGAHAAGIDACWYNPEGFPFRRTGGRAGIRDPNLWEIKKTSEKNKSRPQKN